MGCVSGFRCIADRRTNSSTFVAEDAQGSFTIGFGCPLNIHTVLLVVGATKRDNEKSRGDATLIFIGSKAVPLPQR
jgi:hypothetical protein